LGVRLLQVDTHHRQVETITSCQLLDRVRPLLLVKDRIKSSWVLQVRLVDYLRNLNLNHRSSRRRVCPITQKWQLTISFDKECKPLHRFMSRPQTGTDRSPHPLLRICLCRRRLSRVQHIKCSLDLQVLEFHLILPTLALCTILALISLSILLSPTRTSLFRILHITTSRCNLRIKPEIRLSESLILNTLPLPPLLSHPSITTRLTMSSNKID